MTMVPVIRDNYRIKIGKEEINSARLSMSKVTKNTTLPTLIGIKINVVAFCERQKKRLLMKYIIVKNKHMR